jgi:Tol biopolymer transport system component
MQRRKPRSFFAESFQQWDISLPRAYAGSFSPDGKQIVFRPQSGDSYSLAVVDRDGANLRRLTTGAGMPRFIDWGTHP